ncbi:actin-binding protein WASF3-like isoform X3 [Ambystoma mexicanum]|uniref:actin-binding protein WASF3-like isoform X3 n=1 Tax=Ambystoma mexicanum TaxID=8296 RepID=UPI0037E77614
MPLVKRNIEPRHLCRGTVPNGVTSELECVTNSTLAAIIKQLGSLSRHAEDIFGELFNEANSFYVRMNSLQERVDLLVIKVTQLDSTVEEERSDEGIEVDFSLIIVSLQDINMRKAFKSSMVQNQQVVSRNSIPNPVMEMYHRCDKPPPLNILTPYRDDRKDGLKFYTDPSYFFNLWKEKMLQATEDKRKEKRRQKEQRLVEDPTREVKKVRKARNRRLEWNMMAYDKEFRPDNRSYASDVGDHSYPASPNHIAQQVIAPVPHMLPENKEIMLVANQLQEHSYRPSSAGSRQNSLNRALQPHVPQPPEAILNGPRPQILKDYGPQQKTMAEYFVPPAPPPPPPIIPSAQTAFDSPISAPPPMAPNMPASMTLSAYIPAPPPAPPCPYSASPPKTGLLGPPVAPPPPPPGPPSFAASPAHTASPSAMNMEPRKPQVPLIPMSDARSDLLAAIRRGFQLRKVQEQREQEAKKEPVGNDVATILSRRIAVEYSESDDDSELEENEWSD